MTFCFTKLKYSEDWNKHPHPNIHFSEIFHSGNICSASPVYHPPLYFGLRSRSSLYLCFCNEFSRNKETYSIHGETNVRLTNKSELKPSETAVHFPLQAVQTLHKTVIELNGHSYISVRSSKTC